MTTLIARVLLLVLVTALHSAAAGRQLTGQHAPATTPALSASEAQKRFTLPKGFTIRLFAAEPDVINPVAMTWDDRGRLWVVELFEYPLGAKTGEKPRDRVKILEDRDGDGRADKVTIFADGLNLATGILLGYGGAFVGQAPHLLFLQDTNGDDVADRRTEVMTGFGLEDRHELLNGFTWGPDGYLYMTHGVFTRSEVRAPLEPSAVTSVTGPASPVLLSAGVARFHPRTHKFEVFAEGTSNPWGVDFDRAGNAFVSACVIDHLFHLVPGGNYVRQAGSPPYPYAYELLPSIVDHRHHMAAYAGVQVYQGDQYPEEYRGTILMGNIHDNAVHQDRLTPTGSTFKASFMQDFVRANDGWFRPVSQQIGPDGVLWLMDWYDKYPCYQNANADPEGVDREHGRIWRVVYTGDNPGKSVPAHETSLQLSAKTSAELVGLLAHRNIWHRRMAQRILTERSDPETSQPLVELLRNAKDLDARMAALWTLHTSQLLNPKELRDLASDPEPEVRIWVARIIGEWRSILGADRAVLQRLAKDPVPAVRLAVAVAARQLISGSLTVNTDRPGGKLPIANIVTAVIMGSAREEDPVLRHILWAAAEPTIPIEAHRILPWFHEHGMTNLPMSAQLVKNIMRRLCDAGQQQQLESPISFLDGLPADAGPLIHAALDGLIEGQRGRSIAPAASTTGMFAKLAANPDSGIVSKAQRLGSLWGDASALQALFAKIVDGQATDKDRMDAVRAARQLKSDTSREVIIELIARGASEPVMVEAIAALSELGGEASATALLKHWMRLPPKARNAAAESMVSRRQWRDPFLDALEEGQISPSDIPATVIRTLLQSKDEWLRNRAAKAIGRVREADADKLKLIADRRRVVLAGQPDLAAGHQVAQKICLNCHKLHGEGAEVGPDLTGVGRSTLDALLSNIIDPNQLIGMGYENVEIETKDGRSLSGRLVEDTDARVRLLVAGPREEVIARGEVRSQRISEVSVMPEGLEQMPESDFRDLVWYILNPPQDQRPLTPEVRKQLIGGE